MLAAIDLNDDIVNNNTVSTADQGSRATSIFSLATDVLLYNQKPDIQTHTFNSRLCKEVVAMFFNSKEPLIILLSYSLQQNLTRSNAETRAVFKATTFFSTRH